MNTAATALTRKATIREMVNAFEATAAVVRRCFAELREAEASVNRAFCNSETFDAIRIDATAERGRYQSRSVYDDETAIKTMERHAWRQLSERLEMRRILSVAKAKELDKQLDDEELPPITEANVEAFVQKYMRDLPSLLSDSIREVFEFLRPHAGYAGSQYKTNPRFELGEKVILTNWAERWHNGKFHMNYYYMHHANALERVFQALDGQGEILKGYDSCLAAAMDASSDGEGETAYFRFKACKNHNLHLWFKRPDLVAKLNAVAGGKNLKDC